jgi:hypothetical protein
MAANAGAVSIPDVGPEKEFAAERLQMSPTLGYAEEAMKARLEASGTDLLETVKGRLERSNKLAQAESTAEEEADGESRFNAQRDQIVEKEYQSILMILPGDADKRINLNLSIGALSLDMDPRNPKTAPSGYWESRLAQNRSELSGLDADLDRKMRRAMTVQAAEIAQVKKSIDSETASKIAQSDAGLKEKMAASMVEYRNLLSERRDSILGAARAYDLQMVTALEAGTEQSVVPAAKPGLSMLDSRANRDWSERISATVKYLTGQRQRQLTLVRQETLREALDVAKHKNLLIVGWGSTASGTDLTDQILGGLRGHGWAQ